MLKLCILPISFALLLLGCGGYEEMEIFEHGRYKCHDEQYDYSTQYCDDGIVKNKETFTDERDGKIYKYVKIGKQTWMAENLNYEVPNSKCYDDDPKNCEIFGKMYYFETAKTICPKDWHLPDDNDFMLLENFVESASRCTYCAGIVLKSNNDLWTSNRGTDEFGFTSLPGGVYRYNSYINKGRNAGSWSATEGYQSGSAHFRHFDERPELLVDGLYIGIDLVYVRCIRD